LQSVICPTRAPAVQGKAAELLQLMEERPTPRDYRVTPHPKVPRTAEMTPTDLAIGFTILEGDRFRDILPIDYALHLNKRSSNITGLCEVNNKIIAWIQGRILFAQNIKARVAFTEFFIKVAMECRRYRNFASMSAITIALNSAHIRRCFLTRKLVREDMRELLRGLDRILNPSSNHQAYRAAVKEVRDSKYAKNCIPWIAVHLRDLYSILNQSRRVVTREGRSLINFERYAKFADHVNELVRFKPACLERHRNQGQLAYVEVHARNVYPTPELDEKLMTRSMKVHQEESREWRQREHDLKKLGFRIT